MAKPHTLETPSRLDFGIALDPQVWSSEKGDGVKFEIYIENNSSTSCVFSKYIDPKNIQYDRRWNNFVIDLDTGKNISITFVTQSGPRNNNAYDWAYWRNPKIVPIAKSKED